MADIAVELLEPREGDLQRAREQVKQLLLRARIKKIVCVDDDFEGDIDDVVAACALLTADGDPVSHLEKIDFSTPQEIWEPEVRAAWEALTEADRRVCLASARQKVGTTDEVNQLNAGALAPLVSDVVDFQPVTAGEWTASVAAATLRAAPEVATLVLFDRNMGEIDGLKLVSALFAADSTQCLWAGLLTHTVTKDSEHAAWQELAGTPGIASNRFVVISKQHLGPDPLTFPQSLKVTLMSRSASSLRSHVATSIRESVDDALRELQGLSPQEFERIVFATSRDEGIWEPDTLLRLFDICIRSDARRRLYESNVVKDDASWLRGLADIETKPAPTTVQARAIQHREIYEDPEHLNRVHLPVELGDIFKIRTKLFVLIEQPCDLMVRKGGRRAPELHDVRLVQLAEGDFGGRADAFELPSFDTTSGKPMWVRFGRTEVVPIEVIDYCVFDDDGRARLDTGGLASVMLWPVWTQRHARLLSAASKRVASLDGAPDKFRKDIVSGLLRVGATHPVRGDIVDGVVEYDAQRVGRVLPAFARALLTRYSLYKARDAFQVPIAGSEDES